MPQPSSTPVGPQRLLPGLQRQRHDREPRPPRLADRGDAHARLRGHRRQRRQRRPYRRDPGRARADLPARAHRASHEEPRIRGRAAQRLLHVHQDVRLLHRRRRPVRSDRDGAPVGAHGRGRGSGERLQDQPFGSPAPHRHRPHLPPRGEDALRVEGARRGLRLPADAAVDLRSHLAREGQRGHLPRVDEEDSRRRFSHRGSAGASLPPGARQVAVLQLQPAFSARAST